MNMLNADEIKWIEDSKEDIEKIRDRVKNIDEVIADDSDVVADDNQGALAKMKNFVKKAVNCCIE